MMMPDQPPWMVTLAELVREALALARTGVPSTVTLEELDEGGEVLWHAHHRSAASFERHVVGLVAEAAQATVHGRRYSRRP
jgi:hypothetical protein